MSKKRRVIHEPRVAPAHQPVVLSVDELGEGLVVCRADARGCDRQRVVAVAQDRLGVVVVEDELTTRKDAVELVAQHRHDDLARSARCVPLHVEARGTGTVPSVAEERPPGVVGAVRGAMVGHDVHEQPDPGGVQPAEESGERRFSAELRAHVARIDHVVAVAAPGHRLRDGRHVHVRGPERLHVLEEVTRRVEIEGGVELDPIRRDGLDHPSSQLSRTIDRGRTRARLPGR